jgi:hypothetical protein
MNTTLSDIIELILIIFIGIPMLLVICIICLIIYMSPYIVAGTALLLIYTKLLR